MQRCARPYFRIVQEVSKHYRRQKAWSLVTSSDTHKVYGFFSALSSSETLFLPVRNCKQLLYRSLHGLPHKNRCLGYLLLLLLTFLHHVVVTVRRLSVARGFLLRELPTTRQLISQQRLKRMPVNEAGKYSVGQSTGNKHEKTVQRWKSPIRLVVKCGNVWLTSQREPM